MVSTKADQRRIEHFARRRCKLDRCRNSPYEDQLAVSEVHKQNPLYSQIVHNL